MTAAVEAYVLPYSYVVGQRQLKMALELNHVCPRIGGVLASGERGTAKSTAVRAFSLMVSGALPVTLPINATDDRVVGGWRIDDLLQGKAVEQPGLLEEAGRNGILYVDEVNLLDDHLVNIILDVSSTGILTVQREGVDRELRLDFTLVGTMNPEEGSLRPQLLDRFGLMVDVSGEADLTTRAEILQTVLRVDEAHGQPVSHFLEQGRSKDRALRLRLLAARDRLHDVVVGPDAALLCATTAAAFSAAGHRGDIVLALAARALAALQGDSEVGPDHVAGVAQLALQHRRHGGDARGPASWDDADDDVLRQVLEGAG